MSADINALIPELRQPAEALVLLAQRAGVGGRVTSTLRSSTEQERLYRRFQQGMSQYPVAPPGKSAHEYGYAFDFVVNSEEDQYDLGHVWKSWGGVWGVSDPIHFEFPGFHAPRGTPTPRTNPYRHRIAVAADFILGFVPYIGEVELAAQLLKFGFPEWAILDWLASPIETLEKSF